MCIELFWREINQLYLLGRSSEEVIHINHLCSIVVSNSLFSLFFFLFPALLFFRYRRPFDRSCKPESLLNS